MNRIEADRPDETVQRQIARATSRLRRYRLAHDRAREHRLKDLPWLADVIASTLAEPEDKTALHS